MTETPADMMARALRLLLEPYRGSSDASLMQACKDVRIPGGLGRHSPGEVLYARMALKAHDEASKAVKR